MGLGLRDASKRRTRLALSAAAIDIVASEGIEALTAERVAERAGVSRRTFFNYFSRLEDALTASLEQVTTDTVEALVDRPEGESLRDSVHAVMTGLLDSPVFEQGRVIQRAALESPATRHFLREFQESHVEAIESGLYRRLGPDADPVYVTVLAATAASVFARVTRLAVLQESQGRAPYTPAEMHRLILQCVDLIFSGFDESRSHTRSQKKG